MKITRNNYKTIFAKISQIGIINTIRINFSYFKFKDAVKFPIIASRNLKIRKLGGKVKIFNLTTGCVQIGFDEISIFGCQKERAIWDVHPEGNILFEGTAKFGNGCRICVMDRGRLVIGTTFYATAKTTFICRNEIRIGKDAFFSWEILIMDSDFHPIYDNNGKCLNNNEAIVISDKVWVCCRSTILKGTKLPSGTIIAAGSVVNKKIDSPNSMYGGVPCRLLRTNVLWDYDFK